MLINQKQKKNSEIHISILVYSVCVPLFHSEKSRRAAYEENN